MHFCVMKIHLLRHAKTNQYSETGRDLDRNLLEKGIKQSRILAEFIHGMENIEIHCSSSKRTRQTFEHIFKDKQFASIHFSEELYLCSSKQLLTYVTNLKTKKDILIIGHNDGISDFASYISNQDIYFKTAGYYCFEAQIQSWMELSQGTAKLIDAFRPEVD
jgi:phosphohistidine phosphatase